MTLRIVNIIKQMKSDFEHFSLWFRVFGPYGKYRMRKLENGLRKLQEKYP
jgi:hypothetical protein